MRLSVKVALLGAGVVFLASAALVLLSVWQSGQYNTLAQGEVDALIKADLDHITQGVYNLVQTENEAVQEQVNGNLRVARHLLNKAGGAGLWSETVSWAAVNQLTRDTQNRRCPSSWSATNGSARSAMSQQKHPWLTRWPGLWEERPPSFSA